MLLSAANTGAGALPAAGKGGGGMVSGLLEFIDLDSVIVADSGNPIADLAALGHGLLNAALAAIAALMGAATGSGLLESIPFIGKGLDIFESAWQVTTPATGSVAMPAGWPIPIRSCCASYRRNGAAAGRTGGHGRWPRSEENGNDCEEPGYYEACQPCRGRRSAEAGRDRSSRRGAAEDPGA